MLKQLQQLRTLLLALLVMAGAGNGWGQTTATIEFNTNGTQINAASVTGDDSQGNTWTITTVGTTSFTENPDYSHVGSSKYPAKSITFTTTLANDVNITSFSAKFGGFGGTAGTVTLKVGDTPVGTGSLNGTSDVTVNSTSSATGKVLTVTVTGISKGVKAYYISYTYEPAAALEKTDPTITFNAGSVHVGKTLDLSTLFTSTSTGDVTYSISEGDTYASLSGSFLTGNAAGTVTVKAEQAKTTTYNAGEATATITVTAAPTLSSIAVTTPPTKTTYSEGETFNPEGMVVTATYTDNSTDVVTSSCTFTPSDALTTSINEITVSYTEGGTTKTATQSITVNSYVQPTEISFPLNNTGFGTSYNGSVSDITDDNPITNTINNLTVTYAGSGYHYLNDTQIRLYPNNKLTFEAPSGYEITNIVLIPVSGGTWTATISSNPGTYDNSSKTWTGSASLVEFSGSGSSGRCDIASATITLAVQKSTSDLSVTTTSSVELDITSANIHPTSTITYTTSSTGTVTFESDDTSVATVSSTGVITAQGEGTATITISQAADDTHKAGEQKVTVNVTDNRSAVVTDIDLPKAQKTLSEGDHGDFDPTATVTEGFTGGTVSYSFVTSDASVVNVDGTTFSAEAPGTATITITATPTGGNAENYKPATKDVVVTVMGETTLQLSTSSVNTTYGTNATTVTATVSSGYDGKLKAESSNTSIATASVEGITITINTVAVGTATITVTAPETSTFSGEATETINVTVAAPEGKTKAAVNGYGKVTSTSDLESGEYLIVYEDGNVAFDGGLGTLDASNNTIDVTIDENNVIAITDAVDAAAFTIDVAAGTIKSASGKYIGVSSNSNGLKQSEDASTYTNSFSIDEDGNAVISAVFSGSNNMSLRYNKASNQTRFRYYSSGQESIALYKRTSLTAKFNASGYATYCSEYPLDFSTAEDYSAWQVKGVDGNAITFEKVTGSVKGGTGLLLMGERDATVTLTSENSTNELGDNLLEGTLAPTFVKANEYYGLSGQQFLKVNPGTVKAGKALLPASVVENAGNVRTLSLVFVDPTTGIAETKTMTNEDAIYNLQGQRIGKAQRGVNIIGGKKVLVK